MDTVRITIVGKDIFKLVERKCELVGLNNVNQVNNGMLGNLKTLTLSFDIREDKIIPIRRNFMAKCAEDNMRLMATYVHGDWMRIFVFDPNTIRV